MSMRFSERRGEPGRPMNEQRFFNVADFAGEFRVEKRSDGKPSMITGYPAKFNKLSQRMWGMRENILPGAFSRSLNTGADVRSLLNHNPDFVLGRTVSGTLRLKEDGVGLAQEVDPPDTQTARDLMTSIDRGDINQGSFQFRCITDAWRTEGGETVRDLVDVELIDVSVVTFPAYLDTSAQVRAASGLIIGLDFERLGAILVKTEHKLEVNGEDRAFLAKAVDLFTEAQMCANRAVVELPPSPYLDAAKRRLALADRA